MNNRIKQIRTDNNLTQQEFADRLNIGKFTVAKWESGARGLHGTSVKAICTEFGVNEEWLTNGTGSMYTEKGIYDEIGEFVRGLSDHPPDVFKLRIMRVMARLPEEHWQTLADIATGLYKEFKESKSEE